MIYEILHYEKIWVTEGIEVNKKVISVTIGIFLNKGFKFQLSLYNESHDVLMMSIDLNSIAILKIHSVDYCYSVFRISKSGALDLFKKMLIWVEKVSHYEI